jgi:hypothetical protein
MQPVVAQNQWTMGQVEGEGTMVMDAAKIAQMEKELEEARDQLLREDGLRYRIIMREISEEEKERILDGLKDRRERILFGLEPPGSGRAGERPAKSGGDLECSLCGKGGLTELGLKLHMAESIIKGGKGRPPHQHKAPQSIGSSASNSQAF